MWKCPECGREFKAQNQHHFCSHSPANIDEYICEQEKAVQPILKKIRETIKEAAPEAEEKMSWRMPTFWQKENLIHFAAFKKHIGIYPGGEATGIFAKRLKGYKYAKGTIQLPIDMPIDFDLISDITKHRVAAATKKSTKKNT